MSDSGKSGRKSGSGAGKNGAGAADIDLDIVPAELITRRVRLAAVLILVLAIAIAAVSWVLWSPWVALLAGAILGLPAIGAAAMAGKGRLVLRGGVIERSAAFRPIRVDLGRADVALHARSGRICQVVLRASEGGSAVNVVMAVYSEDDRGRELPPQALRALADALPEGSPIAAALIGQLRCVARDAPLANRPLYRAVEMVRDRDRPGTGALNAKQVSELVD